MVHAAAERSFRKKLSSPSRRSELSVDRKLSLLLGGRGAAIVGWTRGRYCWVDEGRFWVEGPLLLGGRVGKCLQFEGGFWYHV